MARYRQSGAGLGTILKQTLRRRGLVLLGGGLILRAVVGEANFNRVGPFCVDLFQDELVLFLPEIGMTAARQVREIAALGPTHANIRPADADGQRSDCQQPCHRVRPAIRVGLCVGGICRLGQLYRLPRHGARNLSAGRSVDLPDLVAWHHVSVHADRRHSGGLSAWQRLLQP